MLRDRIEKKHVYTAITIVSALIFMALVWQYKKYSDDWFGVNIFICNGILVIPIMFIFSRLSWFQIGYSTPNKMMTIVMVGLILSLFLGVVFAEQSYSQVRAPEYVYDYDKTFAGRYFLFSNLLDFDFDMDFDDEGLAILFLVILIILLVLGAVFIPHFWIVSGTTLIAIMGLLALREYQVIEEGEEWDDSSRLDYL